MDFDIVSDAASADKHMKKQMAELIASAFPAAYGEMKAAIKEVEECCDKNRILKIAINAENTVLGWAGGISSYGGNVWELHPLVVREDMRGQGIGSALVYALEEQVKKRGGITVYLGTDDEDYSTSLGGSDVYPDVMGHIKNIRNIKKHPYSFYEKLGYVIVGLCPDANGFGKPDIFMAKRVGELKDV